MCHAITSVLVLVVVLDWGGLPVTKPQSDLSQQSGSSILQEPWEKTELFEDEDDDEYENEYRGVRRSPSLHRDFADVDIHLTVSAFTNILDLEGTIVQSGDRISFLRHIAALGKLYDNADARTRAVT